MAPLRKHALLIGIDRYPFLPDRWQLAGCVNDVRALAELLRGRFGFASESVEVLENEAATRERILGSLEALRGRAGAGDAVVLAYSGHGSRVRDPEGDDPDGWDETIVPADSGRGEHPNRDIRDDDLHAWLLALSEITPRITLIFDSCFSGGITRDPFAARIRWIEPDERPVASHVRSAGALPGSRRGALRKGPSGWLPLSDRYVLLAACRHDESAHEIVLGEGERAVHHGVLSYFLQRELTAAVADASHRDVFERAALQVTALFQRQHPQLEGARDRELFGERVLAPFRFLPVREREGSRIVLAGGAAHGLTVGSVWRIFPQGTRRADPETPPLGQAEIRQVGAFAAEGEVVEEPGERPIRPGDRAVEHLHDYGEMRLLVDVSGVEGDAASAVEAALRGISLLRAAVPGEAAQARIYLLHPRGAVRAGDPVPQLGPVTETAWAVVDAAGELIAPIRPVSDSASLQRLTEDLQKRARYVLALRIDNLAPESEIRDKIELRLLRRSGGEWATASLGEAGETPLYQEGEWLALEVTNRSAFPVYVSILDFGLTGRISLLYPVAGRNEPLAAGRSLRIGACRGEEMELFIPPELPFASGTEMVQGTEFVKLIATTEESDFEPLLQEGHRGAAVGNPAPRGPLADLLAGVMEGRGRREIRPALRAATDWMTVTRSFLLRGRTAARATVQSQ